VGVPFNLLTDLDRTLHAAIRGKWENSALFLRGASRYKIPNNAAATAAAYRLKMKSNVL
jgi:hypothetical protein